MKPILPLLLFLHVIQASVAAQDTLPRFSLIHAGNNRIIVGWVNRLPNVRQISIQRSADSLTGYKSILTVADPTTELNGYMDTRAPNDRMFYRLYIMQEGGRFLFTAAKRPDRDSLRLLRPAPDKDTSRIGRPLPDDDTTLNKPPVKKPAIVPPVTIPVSDSIYRIKPIVIKLDGFPGTGGDTVAVPSRVVLKKPDTYVPSLFVYTCRDGLVCVRLPQREKAKKYSIRFFDQELLLFELRDLPEQEFKLDKSSFYHAGWFRFELYEDGKLIDRNKFYLEKDF